jgi:hypothetical protein
MNAYIVLNYAFYVLYVVAYLGLWGRAPEYLDYLSTILKLYVGIVLILTFNPFMQLSSSGMKRQIAFSAGIFVLASLSLDKVLVIVDALDPALSSLALI